MAADAVVIAFTFLLATVLRIPAHLIDAGLLPEQLLVVSALMIAGLVYHGAYELQRVRDAQDVLTRLLLGSLVGLGLIVVSAFVLPDLAVGRGVFALHAALTVPLLLVWRRVLYTTLRESALRPRAIVLGSGPSAVKVARALASARVGGAEVVGILEPNRAGPAPAPEGAPGDEPGVPVIGAYADLCAIVERARVEQMVVVDGSRDNGLPIGDVLALGRRGLVVLDGSSAYESVTGKLLVEKLTPGWLVFANGFERPPFIMALRRVGNVVIALLGLVLISPLLLATAIAVKLDSKGPVLFRQTRVGEAGKLFEILKFRTMRENAEAATGAVWATAGDPRVTRVGRILRSTRIDELPQLWNVFRGDLFFVGPRPERPEFVEKLRREVPFYDQRHSIRPGITGWAQINYRYGSTVEDAVEKLHYDLYYVQNMSLLLDIEIVIGTIRVVLGAENAN